MKKFLFLSIAATLICSLSFATIRRVGFFGPSVSGVDYASLQLAHNAASAGDTITMMPGSAVHCNMTKGLIIIGPGFLLNPAEPLVGNANLQANINSTDPGGLISFGAGSSNTQIIGCTIFYITFDNAALTNILIKRCRFTFSGYNVLFNNSISNLTFQQCFFNANCAVNSGSGSITGMSFLSCLFVNFGNNVIAVSSTQYTTSGLINNCIFDNGPVVLGTGAWQVSNCISQGGGFTGTNIVYNNNIGTSTQFPAGNGNQQNKPWNTIFNLTGSYDGKYALKAGSPAIGAGVNGAAATDCGIFGGATPYRLSGIPSVPTIYALTSPQGTIPAGNTVQINLSTRSNN